MKDPVIENELRRNASGYPDPTAYEAIKNVEHDEELAAQMDDAERHRRFIGGILRFCELADYRLVEHIVVEDKRTGKIWR